MTMTMAAGVMKLALGLGLTLAARGAGAQQRVDEHRLLPADGTVVVEVGVGSVHVVAWEKAELSVGGSLHDDADRLSVRGSGRKMHVEVEPAHAGRPAGGDLEIHVPTGCRVEVESFQASVKVEGVKGSVRVETVNGAITLSGGAEDVQLESVNGAVSVQGRSARLKAESANGPVTVVDPGPDIQAGTVNGTLTVTGARAVLRAHLESVNGPVSFEGQVAARGALEVENVGGSVDLAISGAADFKITTFNGAIVNQLGPAPRRSHDDQDDDMPDRELTFSVGTGGGRISVDTLNGRVRLLSPARHD